MNSKVYYGSFYSKSYPLGMRIPTLYDFQFEHQALANLKKMKVMLNSSKNITKLINIH